MKKLTIGKLAELTGVTSDTLRYYEKMGLIQHTSRSPAGYRLYDFSMVRVIRFIRGAKTLNFSLRDIKRLLSYSISNQPHCLIALKQVEKKIIEAEGKLAEFREIREFLDSFANACVDDGKNMKKISDYIQQGDDVEQSKKSDLLSA